jgi:hypothetical protein
MKVNGRKRIRIEVTLNKHTIDILGKLADRMGMSRSMVIDQAVKAYLGQVVTYGNIWDPPEEKPERSGDWGGATFPRDEKK